MAISGFTRASFPSGHRPRYKLVSARPHISPSGQDRINEKNLAKKMRHTRARIRVLCTRKSKTICSVVRTGCSGKTPTLRSISYIKKKKKQTKKPSVIPSKPRSTATTNQVTKRSASAPVRSGYAPNRRADPKGYILL